MSLNFYLLFNNLNCTCVACLEFVLSSDLQPLSLSSSLLMLKIQCDNFTSVKFAQVEPALGRQTKVFLFTTVTSKE